MIKVLLTLEIKSDTADLKEVMVVEMNKKQSVADSVIVAALYKLWQDIQVLAFGGMIDNDSFSINKTVQEKKPS